jgi:hypothetical protein
VHPDGREDVQEKEEVIDGAGNRRVTNSSKGDPMRLDY